MFSYLIINLHKEVLYKGDNRINKNSIKEESNNLMKEVLIFNRSILKPTLLTILFLRH